MRSHIYLQHNDQTLSSTNLGYFHQKVFFKHFDVKNHIANNINQRSIQIQKQMEKKSCNKLQTLRYSQFYCFHNFPVEFLQNYIQQAISIIVSYRINKIEKISLNRSMSTKKPVLYEDNVVRINPEEIQIFQYFYPLPMNKTINMSDVKEVNLRSDVDKKQDYLEIIVSGFSMNATFSPKDPNKCLDIIRCHACLDQAGKSIEQAKGNVKTGVEDVKTKALQTKEDIKQGAQDLKRDAQKKWEEGKKQVKQEMNKEPGIIENVTSTLSQGWQEVKEVSHDIYQAATQKIHEMTAPETETKARQAKQDFKQGARNIKEGAQDVGRDVGRKMEQGKRQAKQVTGMKPQKSTYENIKQSAAQGWENLKQGASTAYNKTAQKVSEVVGTDAQSKAKQARQDFKQGAKDTKESLKKATEPEKPLTEQAKEKFQQITGTDAKGKAQDAKEHFKQGAEDALQSAKKATGYEGSSLQEAKQNLAEGWENTKKAAQSTYDKAAQKLSDAGSSTQQAVGEKTKQAGQALKQKGNQMKQNA